MIQLGRNARLSMHYVLSATQGGKSTFYSVSYQLTAPQILRCWFSPQSVFRDCLNSLSATLLPFPRTGRSDGCAIWLHESSRSRFCKTALWQNAAGPHGGEMWMWMFSNSSRQDEITDLGMQNASGLWQAGENRRPAANFAVAGRPWLITERRGRRDTQETGLTWRPEQPPHLQWALTLRSYCCLFVSFRSTWSPAEVNNLISQTRPGVGERCRLPRFMVCYQRNGTVIYAALHLPSLFVHRPGFSI